MTSRLTWYPSTVAKFTDIAPRQAHRLASVEAAGLAAKRINSSYSGALARDVARVKPTGEISSVVGSSLPYARIENFGGVIRSRSGRRLLIHGRGGAQGTGRTTTGGPVVASAESVRHEGKHYLEIAMRAYPRLFTNALKRLLPG